MRGDEEARIIDAQDAKISRQGKLLAEALTMIAHHNAGCDISEQEYKDSADLMERIKDEKAKD